MHFKEVTELDQAFVSYETQIICEKRIRTSDQIKCVVVFNDDDESTRTDRQYD
jgi:hypothetical protein